MGNFGIAFSEKADALDQIALRLRAEAARKRDMHQHRLAAEIRQRVDRRAKSKLGPRFKDGPFQKLLCWTSYYTMVYAAFCAFLPGHVVYAADRVSHLVAVEISGERGEPIESIVDDPIYNTGNWKLRPGR